MEFRQWERNFGIQYFELSLFSVRKCWDVHHHYSVAQALTSFFYLVLSCYKLLFPTSFLEVLETTPFMIRSCFIWSNYYFSGCQLFYPRNFLVNLNFLRVLQVENKICLKLNHKNFIKSKKRLYGGRNLNIRKGPHHIPPFSFQFIIIYKSKTYYVLHLNYNSLLETYFQCGKSCWDRCHRWR